MTQDDSRKEQAWAYVHGQLDESARREFERLLESDRDLAFLVKQARAMDKRLRRLMPLSRMTEEELEEKILKEWEKSQAAGVAEARPAFAAFVASLADKAAAWLFPMPVLRVAVVVAVCLLAAVGVYHYNLDSLCWEAARIASSPGYRGEAAAEKPAYGLRDLEMFTADVQKRIQASYDELAPPRGAWQRLTGQRRWTLRTELQVLPTGRLLLRTSALDGRTEAEAAEWVEYFEGPGASEESREAFARRVVRDLIEKGRR